MALLDASLAGGDLASKWVDAFGGAAKRLVTTTANYWNRNYSKQGRARNPPAPAPLPNSPAELSARSRDRLRAWS
ncbi:MAG: hypothetical protein IPN21_18905 [Burkholderiales bacterium]|nr:hypothetical protein [Burkholderiales bacterium]